MKRGIASLRACLNFLSVIILIAGLGSAVLIYRTAENNSKGVLGYEEDNGTIYPVMPEDSKSYERNMELYGGKANVLADAQVETLVYRAVAWTITRNHHSLHYRFRVPRHFLRCELRTASLGRQS